MAGQTRAEIEQELALMLLQEWFDWCRNYRPRLGAPRVSPYSRNFQSSRQYDDQAAYSKIHVTRMKTVEWCVDMLPVPMQQAIGAEMRNRYANAKVWQAPAAATFDQALAAIIPKMRERGLFD